MTWLLESSIWYCRGQHLTFACTKAEHTVCKWLLNDKLPYANILNQWIKYIYEVLFSIFYTLRRHSFLQNSRIHTRLTTKYFKSSLRPWDETKLKFAANDLPCLLYKFTDVGRTWPGPRVASWPYASPWSPFTHTAFWSLLLWSVSTEGTLLTMEELSPVSRLKQISFNEFVTTNLTYMYYFGRSLYDLPYCVRHPSHWFHTMLLGNRQL